MNMDISVDADDDALVIIRLYKGLVIDGTSLGKKLTPEIPIRELIMMQEDFLSSYLIYVNDITKTAAINQKITLKIPFLLFPVKKALPQGW